MESVQHYLWCERYRPKTIDETILPVELKQLFQHFVDQNNIPNLLLSGPPGVGKTTVAKALLEQLQCDYIVINGSLNGNIDTLRNEIMQFASSVSLAGGRKYVIIDESDYINPNSTQPALRNFMEEFSKNCGFILTCNYKNKIIAPLHSRCTVIDFVITNNDIPVLASQMLKRLCMILDDNKVRYDKKVVAILLKKYYPDWRRSINELQRYSVSGEIDSGLLATLKDPRLSEVFRFLKEKNFTAIRKWVAENIDVDSATLFRSFYDQATEHVVSNSIPPLVILIARYQYQQAFAADTEINFVAFLTECMIELTFK